MHAFIALVAFDEIRTWWWMLEMLVPQSRNRDVFLRLFGMER